jgi:hypothetical protein
MEEKYFHERLNQLIERGGNVFKMGMPYIFERTCSVTSEKYSLRFPMKFQVKR